eukprot:TRINITY_DN2413_c0_g1_i1.p1 TRINITY_DN2413_c0_g1~~TRINITY_DN2413_c0_g1_i1.p1  ORF type:complete len:597 (-),score=113.16 TRINITY_DN2413_c0_g1_i1:570-2360(-)
MSISKKTKTDVIAASIKRYLNARNIDQQQTKLQMTLEEHALKCVIDRECTLRNAVSYSPDNLDFQSAESQYTNFKIWISGSAENFKPELAQLLYPLFSHIYIRLLALPPAQGAASKFHKRHLSTFQKNPEFKQFIQQLGEIASVDEIEHCPAVASFVASRYCVTLTQDTYNHLHSYLETSECSLILSILNQEVDVVVGDWLGAGSRHDYRSGLLTPPLSDDANMLQEDGEKDEVERLKDLIKIIRDGSPAVPSIALYRIQNQEEVCLSGQVDPQGMHLLSGGEDSQIRLWRLQPSEDPVILDYTSSAVKLGAPPGPSTSSQIIDQDTSQPERRMSERVGNGCARYLRGHSGSVYDAIFLPDQKYLVSVSEDTSVRLWEKSSGAGMAVYHGPTYPVWCVASDTLGTTFATGSMDRTARLWQPEIPHPIRVYAGHEQDVDCVSFHPNDHYVLTGSCDRTVRMWTREDARCVRVLTGHKGVVSAVVVSPCGKIAATAGEDKKIRIWDLTQCKPIKELKGHTDRVTNLIWGDSRLLCSAGMDNSLRVWDVGLGDSELRETFHFSGTILGLNFTDTKTLVGVARDRDSSPPPPVAAMPATS